MSKQKNVDVEAARAGAKLAVVNLLAKDHATSASLIAYRSGDAHSKAIADLLKGFGGIRIRFAGRVVSGRAVLTFEGSGGGSLRPLATLVRADIDACDGRAS